MKKPPRYRKLEQDWAGVMRLVAGQVPLPSNQSYEDIVREDEQPQEGNGFA